MSPQSSRHLLPPYSILPAGRARGCGDSARAPPCVAGAAGPRHPSRADRHADASHRFPRGSAARRGRALASAPERVWQPARMRASSQHPHTPAFAPRPASALWRQGSAGKQRAGTRARTPAAGAAQGLSQGADMTRRYTLTAGYRVYTLWSVHAHATLDRPASSLTVQYSSLVTGDGAAHAGQPISSHVVTS